MNYFKTAMLLASLTALFMGIGFMLGGKTGMLIALVFSVGMNLFAFWNSDKVALRMHNAHEVGPADAPDLYNMVRDLAQNANMPMPKVFIIQDPQPNAFATGRSPNAASVAATTGIMNVLTYEELAGVMAHELAHIKNRDTLIMTISATVAGAISMLAQFGMFFRGSGDQRNPLGFVGILIAMILAPMAASLIQMLISRTREYSADRLGAEICGNPLWLSSALEKIAMGVQRVEMPSAERNPASAHMFIINPLSGRKMDRLFSTHPNTENRISELEKMANEMGIRDFSPSAGKQNHDDSPWG